MMNRSLLVAVALLVAAAGCSQKEKTPGTGGEGSSAAKSNATTSAGIGTKAKLLTDKAWKATEITCEPPIDLNHDGKANSDLIASGEIPECQLDDTDTYRADGAFIADHGAIKCSPQERGKDYGRWSFNPDSTLVSTSLGGHESGIRILELTESKLKESINLTSEGKGYTFVVTFAAK